MKRAHAGWYREFEVFRQIEKVICNLIKFLIFVQKLISALNRPASYAPYFKFAENSIQYLVSYGYSKQAPCRLKFQSSHAEAGKCAISSVCLQFSSRIDLFHRFPKKIYKRRTTTGKIAQNQPPIPLEVRGVIIRSAQRVYKMCILWEKV